MFLVILGILAAIIIPMSKLETKPKPLDLRPYMNNDDKKRLDWWNTIASNDLGNLQDRILVIKRNIQLMLGLRNPIVDFRLDILNASVLEVIIGRTVTGKLIYNYEE